jgi:hypothetical protein
MVRSKHAVAPSGVTDAGMPFGFIRDNNVTLVSEVP